MAKTATFGAMHLVIAFSVTYALTGNVAIAGAVTFVEPLVNTVAHYFFDKGWESSRFTRWRHRVHARLRAVRARFMSSSVLGSAPTATCASVAR